MPFYIVYQTENTRNNGHNFGGGRGWVGVRGPGQKPYWGRRDREVAGVANLGRSPDQPPGGEAYIP